MSSAKQVGDDDDDDDDDDLCWFVAQEMMTADESATSPSQSAVARCKQVEYLQQQMQDLNLEQQLQGAKVNLADPHGTLQK